MYYIYHIPGIKIGCTINPERRIKLSQGYLHWEILEEHLDKDIAAERELILQRQYGYPEDNTPYTFSSNLHTYRTQETFKKMSESKIGIPRPEELKKHFSEIRKGTQEGKSNHNYGKHTKYIELTTNTVGYCTDLAQKFNTRDIPFYAKRGTPIKMGPSKGLHFQVYQK